MSDQDFERLRDLVYRFTGISMGPEKRNLLYSRLARRLRELALIDFSAYCDLLEKKPEQELEAFTNAVTTNLTSFFREQHHFDFLKNEFLPNFMSKRGSLRGLRVWSAGCSTGEEAYSIAMTLHECCGKSASEARILATDIDTEVLDRAKKGIYAFDRIDDLSAERRKQFFLKGVGAKENMVKVQPHLQKIIEFKPFNLTAKRKVDGQFDLVFCRNVAIYFDKKTQTKVYTDLGAALSIGGALIIGHSESLYTLADKFDVIGKTIYRPQNKREA